MRWLGSVDDMAAVENFLPYRGRWELTAVRRYFARPPVPLSVSVLADRTDGGLHWREVSFAAGAGVEAIATVVSPVLVLQGRFAPPWGTENQCSGDGLLHASGTWCGAVCTGGSILFGCVPVDPGRSMVP